MVNGDFMNILSVLAAPTFSNDEKTRIAHILNVMIISSFFSTTTYSIVALLESPYQVYRLLMSLTLLLMTIASYTLMRLGKIRATAIMVPILGLIFTTITVLLTGGIEAPMAGGYFITFLVAGILLGKRGGLIFTVLCLISWGGIFLIEISGKLPDTLVEENVFGLWILKNMLFIVAATALYLATKSIGEALALVNRQRDKLDSAHRKLENVNIGLEKRVQERTKELQAEIIVHKKVEEEKLNLREKLNQAERMESLGILAGGAAHDLNNTFVPILSIPDIILSKRSDDSELKDLLNLIKNATKRAAGTISDLLTLARRGKYEMKPLNLNNLLNELFNSPAFKEVQDRNPKVTLEKNLSKDIANIKGSEAHLTQVVMNLVKNAYEAMEHGGKLRIKTSNTFLATTLRAYTDISAGDYTLLEIADNGTGIKNKDLRKIFEPFYTQKELGDSGSGLGLAVVWGVVKDHEAYIDVGSDYGSGATFSIYLPSTDEIEEEDSEEKTDIDGTEKILIVDDVKEQLETLDVILSSLGYHVDVVQNGHLAVKFLENNDVDLVVLDMLLEESFDGLDTYKEILKIKQNQKSIIVSGFAKTERVENAMRLGVGNYIRKPYTVDIIGKAVRNELDKK